MNLDIDRFYLSKFKRWIDQFKFLNPLEYDSVIKKSFFNNTHEVLWIEFKSPEFSCCVVQDDKYCFDFYFAYAGTNVKIKNCDFNKIVHTSATLKDLSNLEFLSKLGMLSIIQENIFGSGLVEAKFTLQERIFQNGSI